VNGLRVGLGTTMIEPGLNGGRMDGIGVYTRALLDHLPEAGCEVLPYSWPKFRGSAADVTVGKPMPQSFERATAIDLVTPPFFRVHMPADIYHATDYRVVRMDCPVVATLHDALTITHPEWCSPRLRKTKNWLQAKAARKAQHVIAPSYSAIPELVRHFGVDEKRISVVPQGVDASWLEPPNPIHAKVTQNVNKLQPGYFLFVGTLQPRKNIERILDAYLALPRRIRDERQLIIVGGPGWRSENLIARIEAVRQKRERVRWLDKITGPEELRHIYAGAGAFVFPSLYEGFGIPLIEAFASNVPAVTSTTSSLPEVSQGAAVEVDPASVGDIANAMQSLVEDEFLRRRCIELGRARAEQLTWNHTAQRTAAVYRTVLSH
jgi:alpha-1,3-rhamnosyl/mannosyltransferase